MKKFIKRSLWTAGTGITLLSIIVIACMLAPYYLWIDGGIESSDHNLQVVNCNMGKESAYTLLAIEASYIDREKSPDGKSVIIFNGQPIKVALQETSWSGDVDGIYRNCNITRNGGYAWTVTSREAADYVSLQLKDGGFDTIAYPDGEIVKYSSFGFERSINNLHKLRDDNNKAFEKKPL